MAQAEQTAGQTQNKGFLGSLFGIGKNILIFMAFRYAVSYFTGGGGNTSSIPLTGGDSSSNTQIHVPSFSSEPIYPLWRPDTKFSLAVYVSERENELSGLPVFESKFLQFNDASQFEKNVTVHTTDGMKHNASIYAHIFLTKAGYSYKPDNANFHPTAVLYRVHKLNVHRPPPKIKTGKSLLANNTKDTKPDEITSTKESSREWLSYWRPVLPLRLINDFSVVKLSSFPADIASQYSIEENSGRYYPVLYMDYFWYLQERSTLINETVDRLTLEISYRPISLFRWTIQSQVDASWKQQQQWGSSEAETEEFRRMLLETNPYLLGVTVFVSLLHMLFDFLAFKNDVAFWKDKKDMEGLSVRTIFLNCFCQVIIFLYLMDNDTSWMVLLSSGVGCIIEFWKIRQASDVSIIQKNVFGIVRIPWIHIKDKKKYEESGTAKYDKEAMRYLSYALYPLVIGYSIYSLVYEQHKSWYSWVLGSLTGSVYAFGFIMMCPQLYLNYKLKSVAHLPWRMMTYKALNTFIDDLFAFIIKMPFMHRIACFRDDVIFFIFLYQRWIYRTDYSRVNEYGYAPEEDPTNPLYKGKKEVKEETANKIEGSSPSKEIRDTNKENENKTNDSGKLKAE